MIRFECLSPEIRRQTVAFVSPESAARCDALNVPVNLYLAAACSKAGISGTAAKGIALRHVKGVVLKDISVTVASGAKLAVDDAEGEGLEGAEKYVEPARGAGRRAGGGQGDPPRRAAPA